VGRSTVRCSVEKETQERAREESRPSDVHVLRVSGRAGKGGREPSSLCEDDRHSREACYSGCYCCLCRGGGSVERVGVAAAVVALLRCRSNAVHIDPFGGREVELRALRVRGKITVHGGAASARETAERHQVVGEAIA